MSNRVVAGFLVAAGTAWLALARPIDQGDDRSAPAAPVIKLNVSAADAHGQPVADLTREDLQVFDNGKAQQIASFRRNDVKALRATPPRPNEFSNRNGTPLTRATIILLDLLNARFEDRAYAANQLAPALQRLENSDSVFLYLLTMNGALYPVHPLPDPEAPAPIAVKPWTDDIKTLLDEATRKVLALRPGGLTVDERVRMTYDALEALASRVAETPGRKSIVWISHGMPISIGGRSSSIEIDYTPLLRRLTATLDRASVAVYPVRQPGPLAPVATSTLGAALPDSPTSGMASTETLEEFAGLTGGRAFSTVDIAGAITQATNDARMSYLIAFSPGLDKWDGKYHKLRVTCSRKGVRLQTKQGYYAFAGDAHEGDQEKSALRTALSIPFDIPEIGLYGNLKAPPAGSRSTSLELRIDAADVQLAREGELFTPQLAVAFAAYAADGHIEAIPPITYAPRLTSADRQTALQEGLTLVRQFNLPASIRKVRAIVYDRTSGAIGSLAIPVP